MARILNVSTTWGRCLAMNLSQLYYFRKLAELQHYTKTAKELYISQPALSDSIKSLERELGVPLFKREGRNVRLTRYGQEFATYVQRGLNELDKGIEVMREYTGKLSGSLSVGGLYTVTGGFLPALIESYHEKYGTGVQFQIMTDYSLPLVDGLKADRFDVVFAAKGKAEDSTLYYEPVLTQRLVACVNTSHPYAGRESITLEELSSSCVYTYREGTPIGDKVSDLLAAHHVSARKEFDDEISVGGMISANRNNACAVVLDTIGLKPFSNISLIPIDSSEVKPDFHPIYMVYKKAEFKNRALENFIDFVSGSTSFIQSKGDAALNDR